MDSVVEREKPWWRTLNGEPEWMRAWDKPAPWHGWAFASAVLLFFAVLLVIAPKHVVAGPMAASGVMAIFQAIRVRNGGHH